MIIIKNLTQSDLVYCGVICSPNVPRDLTEAGVTQSELLNDDTIIPDFCKGYISVNNGDRDLTSSNEVIALIKLYNCSLRTTDNRIITKENSRPLLTNGCYTSVDDDPTNPYDVGNGTHQVKLDHVMGQSMSVEFPQDFNVELNASYMFEGYSNWTNAKFDEFTFEIRTKATPYTLQAGTNFKRYSTLIIPADGDGDVTFNLSTAYLCSVVPKTDTGLYPMAFWNATFNPSTNQYENLTAAPLGDGKYNIFHTEVTLKRYINRHLMLGNGQFHFSTSDPSQLGTNLKLVYRLITGGPDHDWQCVVNFSMFRKNLI